jgi:hypothetical protein
MGYYINLSRENKKFEFGTKNEVLSLIEKIGGLCSFLAVYLGVFKTLSQENTDEHAFVKYHVLKDIIMYFDRKKIQPQKSSGLVANCI